MVIHTNTISVNPDPRVRWQAKIPRVVIRTNTTSVNLDACVRWQADIPSGYLYTHSSATPTCEKSGSMRRYPRVIRTHTHKSITPTCENRVTCGDTQGLSVHTFMLPRLVRSQVACETPYTVICTHFEDKNVFSHCMPSKATMSSHISKTKMSSVIACLQKATMSSFAF